MPRRNTAMAKAAAWPSVMRPSAASGGVQFATLPVAADVDDPPDRAADESIGDGADHPAHPPVAPVAKRGARQPGIVRVGAIRKRGARGSANGADILAALREVHRR